MFQAQIWISHLILITPWIFVCFISYILLLLRATYVFGTAFIMNIVIIILIIPNICTTVHDSRNKLVLTHWTQPTDMFCWPILRIIILIANIFEWGVLYKNPYFYFSWEFGWSGNRGISFSLCGWFHDNDWSKLSNNCHLFPHLDSMSVLYTLYSACLFHSWYFLSTWKNLSSKYLICKIKVCSHFVTTDTYEV